MFLCLGGGNEVGRSCHVIQYKGKTVMLDAGMHPAYDGLAALPFYDDFDLSTVDLLLISHFHLDHAASLPYVMSKTNFKGRVFMTHPTKAIYKWLIQDSVRVGNTSANSNQQSPLYSEADHLSTFPHIEAIDYYTTHTISSIRITPYPAGHVLGAAMFLIEIGGLKVLFTGDYSREEDRHLIPAEVPKGVKIDVLITESTYGIASHVPRVEREASLMKSITGVLQRGGRVLMPVFALGRAQELLLILDEYWSRHAELQKVPIYYASNLARKCMVVYQTYVGAMNDNIKRLFRERLAEVESAGDVGQAGPWDLKYVRSLKNLERFQDVGGCVMLASPGMLQSGVSRELLERWAPDPKNGVIITGYSVEGTMAKQLVMEPEEIPAVMTSRAITAGRMRGPLGGGEAEKIMIPRRCTVQEFSFAAHVDGPENRAFIEEVSSPVVILVHGEQHNMMRLKSKLLSLNADKSEQDKVKIYSPKNCEELRIPFRADKIAKVVGKLAQMPPPSSSSTSSSKGSPENADSRLITGVLVQNDFKMSLMAAEDLREFAGLTTTTIACRQRLTLSAAGIGLVKWALESTFGAIEEIPEGGHAVSADSKALTNGHGSSRAPVTLHAGRTISYLVMGCITVRYGERGQVEVEWEGNMLNDGIADAVMAVLFAAESSPAAVKQSAKYSHPHQHSHEKTAKRNYHADITPQERLDRLFMFLEAQFGTNISPITRPRLTYDSNLAASSSSKDMASRGADSVSADVPTEGERTGSKDAPLQPHGDSRRSDAEAEAEEEATDEAAAQELKRLHELGIPVPGIEIVVDKHVARVWLEDLDVECPNRTFRDRVQAVVDRAVETVAPLWTRRN